MKTLFIDESLGTAYIIAENNRYAKLGKIENSFGNVIRLFEDRFPEYNETTRSNIIVNNIKAAFESNVHMETIFDFQTYSTILVDISTFFENNLKVLKNERYKGVDFTLLDVEDFRIMYGIETFPYPIIEEYTGEQKGLRFNVKSNLEIVYAFLYYYALNKLKLVKCVHCGKWFATKTLKCEYCKRKSPIEEYSYLECKPAAETFKKKLRARENTIRACWEAYHSDRTDELVNICNDYLETLSVENLTQLNEYLYADDKPKQTRPNRKKKGAT